MRYRVTQNHFKTIIFQCQSPELGEPGIVIQNATIVDGSGNPAFTGNLRIVDGVIANIGQFRQVEGDSTIDASDHVLSPGFIDTHSHHDWDRYPTIEAAISQGITSIIVGQDGRSRFPLQTFIDTIGAHPLSVNLGSYIGHGTLRSRVLGEDFKREATSQEIDSMKSLLEQEMKSGAIGLSTGLEYDPGIYSATEEVVELAKIASKYNGRYISHMRSEDIYLEKSIDEIIQIGKEADIPVQISHFKLGRRSLWGQASQILSKLDSAREEGVEITADIYPYEYWQSTMRVLFPKRDFDNRESAEFALQELTSPEGMIISKFNADPTYEGMTLDKIAELRSEDPASTYMELIKMSDQVPGESIIAKSMDERDIVEIIKWPFSNLCSDGAPTGHPRGWGAFPRYLTMETGQNLEKKIQKMTNQAAINLGLNKVGSIKKGHFADLVLFNPDTVKDNATYEQSTLKASGIEKVFVSGIVVFENLSPTKKFPGRVISLNSNNDF